MLRIIGPVIAGALALVVAQLVRDRRRRWR
jgi:hypothetical protein